MEEDELMKKMEGVTSKVTPKQKKHKNKKRYNPKLWEQLNEETLKKLGYIK